jgi:hypothetical protein
MYFAVSVLSVVKAIPESPMIPEGLAFKSQREHSMKNRSVTDIATAVANLESWQLARHLRAISSVNGFISDTSLRFVSIRTNEPGYFLKNRQTL